MKVFKFKVVEITTTNTTVLDQFTNQIIEISNNTSDDYLKVILDKIDNFDLEKNDMFNI
jgi:hypothetical protein